MEYLRPMSGNSFSRAERNFSLILCSCGGVEEQGRGEGGRRGRGEEKGGEGKEGGRVRGEGEVHVAVADTADMMTYLVILKELHTFLLSAVSANWADID